MWFGGPGGWTGVAIVDALVYAEAVNLSMPVEVRGLLQ